MHKNREAYGNEAKRAFPICEKKPTKQNIYVFGNEVQCLFSIDTDGLFGLRPEPHKGQIITNDVIEF